MEACWWIEGREARSGKSGAGRSGGGRGGREEGRGGGVRGEKEERGGKKRGGRKRDTEKPTRMRTKLLKNIKGGFDIRLNTFLRPLITLVQVALDFMTSAL